MSAAVDILNPRHVAIVASIPPSPNKRDGGLGSGGVKWHPYWEVIENGYQVGIFRPDGGRLESTKWRIRATRVSIQPKTYSALASCPLLNQPEPHY